MNGVQTPWNSLIQRVRLGIGWDVVYSDEVQCILEAQYLLHKYISHHPDVRPGTVKRYQILFHVVPCNFNYSIISSLTTKVHLLDT